MVIMDVRMGAGMNGLETLRKLRQVDGRLPVIMMTAYGTTQTAIEAMKLGAYDYLLKPFDVPKLKEIVHDALKASKAMRQTVSYQPLLATEDYDLGIVGRSACMQEVFKLIGQTAGTDAKPALAALALVAAGGAVAVQFRSQQRVVMAQGAAAVSLAARVADLKLMKDFEPIHRLGAVPKTWVDEDLLAALEPGFAR